MTNSPPFMADWADLIRRHNSEVRELTPVAPAGFRCWWCPTVHPNHADLNKHQVREHFKRAV